jgi:hypothetical protein
VILIDAAAYFEHDVLIKWIIGAMTVERSVIECPIWWNTYSQMYWLCFDETRVIIDAGAHSEHGPVIRCEFKQGSAERSIVHWILWCLRAF